MEDNLLNLWKDLVSIDSVTGNELHILLFIESLLKKNGIDFKRVPVSKGRWDIFAQKGDSKKGILFTGHCDTVPATKEWTIDPFKPRITDGVFFGLGCSDMKSGLAVILYHFLKYKSKRKVGLLITVGEEGGNFEGMKTFVKSNLFESFEYAIVADSSNLDISVEQSGAAAIEVLIEGEQRHTQNFDKGINPIHEATKVINELTKEFSKFRNQKVSRLGNRPILSVNQFHSGKRTNIIPKSCSFTIDRRVSPVENLEDMERFYHNILDKFNHLTWKKTTWVESAKEIDGLLIDKIKSVGKECGREIKVISSMGVSEMVFLRGVGLKSITFGPGLQKNAHIKDEHLPVKNILDYSEIIKRIMNQGLN